MSFLIKQNQSQNIWSYEVDLSFLRLLTKLISHYITTSNITLFREIDSFSGRSWNYRFSQSPRLIQEALAIFKTLIVIKSIPIVQEVYNAILLDAEISLGVLLKSTSSSSLSEQCVSSTEPPTQSVVAEEVAGKERVGLSSVKKAETSFVFDLCIFAELGNAKNNLICMYALSPTLFELLRDKLTPCNWSLADNFPSVQYAILNTLYSHCSRYDHFIASSSLFSSKHGADKALLSNAPTRDHFKQIVELLTKIIPHASSSYDTSILVLNWLYEVFISFYIYVYIFIWIAFIYVLLPPIPLF